MKLNEFHVDQLSARVISERVTVAGVFPTIARDPEGAPDSAGGQHDRFCFEESKAAALAIVCERAGNSITILEQSKDCAFHVNVYALMDAVILERANHLETRAVAHVSKPRVSMTAKVALKDFAVGGAIEHRAPCFEFAHSC